MNRQRSNLQKLQTKRRAILVRFLISSKDAATKRKEKEEGSYFCLLETVRGILTGFFFSSRERFYFGKENCAKFWPTENEFAALNFYELVKVSLRDLYSSWCWDGRRALPETPDEKSSVDGRQHRPWRELLRNAQLTHLFCCQDDAFLVTSLQLANISC